MVTFVLLVCALFMLYRYLKQCHSVFERLGIPGPRPSLLFGNVAEFKSKFPLDVFKDWSRQYGKVFGFYEGLHPSIVISDPWLTQQILVRRFACFSERPPCTPFLNSLDDMSILNANGELWKRQRMVVAKAFNAKSVKEIVPGVTRTSRKLLQRLEAGVQDGVESLDIADLTERYTLDAFANAAFDYNCDSLNNDQELLYRFMLAFNKSGAAENPLAGFARLFPSLTSFLQLFDTEHRQLHALHLKNMGKLIEKEKQKMEDCPEDKSTNLLRRLIEGYSLSIDEDNNEVKRHLSDEEVLSQSTSLVGGGLGPTNSILSFALYLLATNTDAQSKLVEEIDERLSQNESIDYETLSQMEYLDMVIEETSRVFPVIPGVARTCNEDCEIDGIPFRKGMKVRVMAMSMYTDETLFPEPDRFIPERFSKENKEKRPYYSYLPYGHGPRMCVGFKFGLVLIKVALVQILRHYILTSSSKTQVPLQTALRPFLTPRGPVHIGLVRRNT
ncbi:cytochrome P450 3A9-like [Haliotis rufescens]|uniref:cytochrome P450 3A9-like n=1 Tax=Haliotis rufescens TaxID=6454 RepID=UPI00201EFE89|nr:cytochrome P450 3A9-like [Haliotis rufescens]